LPAQGEPIRNARFAKERKKVAKLCFERRRRAFEKS
jgi:hypothetical protein